MTIRLSRDVDDMQQILDLQTLNHKQVLDDAQKADQGFVSVAHEIEVLWDMHCLSPHVVAEDHGQIIGYALAMNKEFGKSIDGLQSTLDLIDQASYKGLQLNDTPYLIMGQVCVAREARGQKLVDRMYDFMSQTYRNQYRFFVTVISLNNTRSIRVHERYGFEELFHESDEQDNWVVVIVDWK
ncbi:MAG: GNAT family N-acetyltransferase [Bacteroidota bacterium]